MNYPQPGWGNAYHAQPPNRRPVLIALGVVLAMASVCVLVGQIRRSERESAQLEQWSRASAQPQTDQVPLAAPPPTAIREHELPSNQLRASYLLVQARTKLRYLTAIDALVEGETGVVTLDAERLHVSMTIAAQLCDDLLQSPGVPRSITHVIVKARTGARLADGFRHEQRCFTDDTPLTRRMAAQPQ